MESRNDSHCGTYALVIVITIIVLYIGGWLLYASGEWVADRFRDEPAPRLARCEVHPEDCHWNAKDDEADWRERYYGFDEGE